MLRQHKAAAFRFGDGVTELARGVNPQLNGFMGVGERRFRSVAMRHAAGQFGDLGDEDLILVAPINLEWQEEQRSKQGEVHPDAKFFG
jgi:hypothetical protein